MHSQLLFLMEIRGSAKSEWEREHRRFLADLKQEDLHRTNRMLANGTCQRNMPTETCLHTVDMADK